MAKKVDVKKIYDHFKSTLGFVPAPMKLLGTHAPEVLDGYYRMRSWYLKDPPQGALPRKFKELLYVALDAVLGAPSHAARAHAVAAVKAGATKEEVAETIGLTVMLAGMPKYMSLGYEILEAAIEEEAKRRKRQA